MQRLQRGERGGDQQLGALVATAQLHPRETQRHSLDGAAAWGHKLEPAGPTPVQCAELSFELGDSQSPGAITRAGTAGSVHRGGKGLSLDPAANGDRWLIRHDNGRAFVRHEANLASDGTVTDSEIADFLTQDGLGPEKQELLRLIGSLADYRITPGGSAA